MKKKIKTIGKTAERIGNTIVSGEGTAVIVDEPETVAVRDYVAGKGYSGLVNWDGQNPTVAGVKVTPTEIRDGISYATKSELDKVISDFESNVGIKNAEKLRTEKYGAAEDKAFNDVVNRKPFSYDPDNDVVFQAYKKQYEREAEHALRRILNENNTSVTGASGAVLSEAMSAQREQLDKITDVIPELYEDAYNRYIGEGEMQNDTFSTINSIANDYYDRIYQSDSDIIDRANAAGLAERQERQRVLDNERNAVVDYYDNAIKEIELRYKEDELRADIAKTNASTEATALGNAIDRGFFIAADEAAMPWLASYRTADGKYTLSPTAAKLAYEYNAAHSRERAKLNAKLGK